MKRSLVTLEILGEDAKLLEALSKEVDLGQLLRDALGEFESARSMPHYVGDRYAHMSEEFRKSKIVDVERRCSVARIIRRAAAAIEILER